MITYGVEVLSESDEDFIASILKALELKNLVRVVKHKKHISDGEEMTNDEFGEMLTNAIKSRSYSFEDAKKHLNL